MQITYTVTTPEIAFTGDTMSDFVVDHANADALMARVLIMEVCYIDYISHTFLLNHGDLFCPYPLGICK